MHGADVLVFLWREVKFIIMFFQKSEGKMKMDKPHQTNIIQSRGISPCQGWTGFFCLKLFVFKQLDRDKHNRLYSADLLCRLIFFSSSQTVWKGRKEMRTYWNSHCNFLDSGIHLTKKVHCSICFFSFFLSTPKLHWAATLTLDVIGPPGLFLWFCVMFLTEEKNNIYIYQSAPALFPPLKTL